MSPEEIFSYLQLAIFILGVLTILIAGLQDKKTRRAPAIYFTPTMIGFGINPFLGLIGLIGTITALFFWKDEWNQKIGLADALLFFTLLICMCNPLTLIFATLITAAFLTDLIWIQKRRSEAPLIYIFAKWIIIVGILALLLTILI